MQRQLAFLLIQRLLGLQLVRFFSGPHLTLIVIKRLVLDALQYQFLYGLSDFLCNL